MDDLKRALIEHKQLTEEISISLESDDFDRLDILLDKKRQVISYINTLQYNPEEFRMVCEEFNLIALEEKVNNIISIKRMEIKNNLDMLNQSKNVSGNYIKKYNVDSIFLSKRV